MRRLVAADVAGMVRLKDAAGWNQTDLDLRRNLELEPEGVFGIDCDGQLAAMASVVCYGQSLAWIGMVLTLPAFRGRGFARQLTEQCIGYVERRGIGCAMLDASAMGEPLYRKLGFEPVCPVERWMLQMPQAGPEHILREELDFSLDVAVFGADRSRLLESLQAHWSLALGGGQFAMGRPGSNAAYFGPMVAGDVAAARRAVEQFLANCGEKTIYWDLFPDHAGAVLLARDLGFRPVRRLLRMRRGAAPETDFQRTYAIAGFEYG